MSTLKANEPFATRYHLIRRIGLGGYSEVWLANDTLAGGLEVTRLGSILAMFLSYWSKFLPKYQ